MKNLLATAGACALLTFVTVDAADMKSADTSATPANPLLAPWTGPYGGVPPFDKVKVADLQPALEAAMAQQLAEIDRIANDPAAPTFENTIAALERTGRTLDRVSTIYGIYTSTMNDDAVQAVEREMAPKLAAFSDQITQNEKLFARIAAVYDARETAGLTPEQQRLTWVYYTNFVRAGAKLDAAAKKRTAEINQQLASLYTTFSQNVLADEDDGVISSTSEADLAGLPEARARRLAQAAEGRGQKGKWVIANTRSSVEPFLTYADAATCARRSGACSSTAATTAARTTTTPSSRRSCSCAPSARKLLGYPDARALAPREHDGEDARARDGADGGGVAAGRRARARGGRRHAGDRRRREGRHQDRAVGLPLLRREGPQGEVRPRRERGQAVPAAREAARGMFCWRRSCSASTSAGRAGRCRSITPTSASGRSRTRRASTSACGTSIRTRARASARARG